jgi:hypothetical protein
MKNRNKRDAERRNYIEQKTEENLRLTKNDPQSLFANSKVSR